MECEDANGVEVFAMRMGCREWHKLEAMSAIVEGDSFVAIQWGLGESKYPWRLVNWVEWVHHILGQLQCNFLPHSARGK